MARLAPALLGLVLSCGGGQTETADDPFRDPGDHLHALVTDDCAPDDGPAVRVRVIDRDEGCGYVGDAVYMLYGIPDSDGHYPWPSHAGGTAEHCDPTGGCAPVPRGVMQLDADSVHIEAEVNGERRHLDLPRVDCPSDVVCG